MPSLKFSTSIYKKETIQNAILAYSHLAKFNIMNNKNYTVVKIEKLDPGYKAILCDEFANYVLGMNKG